MASIDYNALGGRIREARQTTGLTQEQLAEKCSLSCAFVGHIERGTRIPSLETLVAISEVLSVSLDGLVLDSRSSLDAAMLAISSTLKGKDPQKLKRFLSTVKAMADNIENM